ncbi:hypothetical protein [Parapedobacter sp. 2B3]|uniref:hypothetical protein n=1 Tax=Parapedobacter sp. 2B3 TaxID=3342381 RepID=UPI0035B62A83
MKVEYNHFETVRRGYDGISIDEGECRGHLQGAVKDNLLDREEAQHTLDRLRALQSDTGFVASDELMADIQALENANVSAQQFRVGEAYAEVILEQAFTCRFHWNENRDARNPKGNKTGADLVGFIEIDNQVLFLFGEVKTSSETATRPPQVMTSGDGIEKQLRDLSADKQKRSILIQYLSNKARHFPEGHQFRQDFDSGLRAYYSQSQDFHLVGVLVRDVPVDDYDVSLSYHKLKTQILEPNGLKLLALYLPIQKEEWLSIINGA